MTDYFFFTEKISAKRKRLQKLCAVSAISV